MHLKKILRFLLSIFLLSIIVFYASRLAPGDPLTSYYGERVEKMSSAEREWAEQKLGLHKSIPVQYGYWIERAVHGDFGISYKYKMPVLEVIKERLGNTMLLGGISFIIIFFLALFIGILCAWNEGKLLDRMICHVGTITSCIPEFWLSLVFIWIFAMKLQVLPSSGAFSVADRTGFGDRIRHMILPMAVVVLSHLWYYAYLMRNKMVEELQADYVLLARVKGLEKWKIVFRHCLLNSLPSYLNIMAVSVSHILGGTYIVETVFSYPGIGTLTYESVRYKDYNLLMVLCLLSGSIVILCNRIAQGVSEQIDPRMKLHEKLKVWEETQNE